MYAEQNLQSEHISHTLPLQGSCHMLKSFRLKHVSLEAADKKDFCHSLPLLNMWWQVWVFTSARTRAAGLWKVHADTRTVLFLLLYCRLKKTLPPSPCIPLLPAPLLPLAAMVIGYDMGSTGRERGRIWMRRMSSSSLLFSNLMPSSSQPLLAAVTVATSAWPHPLRSFLHPRVLSFIKIVRSCPRVCVCVC